MNKGYCECKRVIRRFNQRARMHKYTINVDAERLGEKY